jgi:hypothetical protein
VVKTAKKIAVFSPPPSFHEHHRGTPASKQPTSTREKLSLPGPSAGRGAFLIDGYYFSRVSGAQLTELQVQEVSSEACLRGPN